MTKMEEHNLTTRVSDNTQTVWMECSCGFETAFYTIVGNGVDAMKAAKDEGEQHANPQPLSEEFQIEADEFPPKKLKRKG